MTAKVPIGSLRSPEEIRRALLGLYGSLTATDAAVQSAKDAIADLGVTDSGLTDALAQNDLVLAQLDVDLAALQVDLDAAKVELAASEIAVAENAAAIIANEAYITATEAALAVDIAANESNLAAAEVDLAANAAAVAATQAEVDAAMLEIAALEAVQGTLQADLDAAEAAINTLNATTLPALQAELDAAEVEVAANAANVAAAVADINANAIVAADASAALQTALDVAEADISTLNVTTVPALQAELNQAEADIAANAATAAAAAAALQVDLDAAEAAVVAAQADVDAAVVAISTKIEQGDAASDINNNAVLVDGGKLVADSVDTAQLAAGAVEAEQINALAVTAGKIATNAVTAGTIAAGTIVAADIAAGAITASKLLVGRIGNNLIPNGDFSAPLDGTWSKSIHYGTGVVELDNSVSVSAGGSLKITGATTYALSKAVYLEYGRTYRLRFKIKTNGQAGAHWGVRMFRNNVTDANGYIQHLDGGNGSVSDKTLTDPDFEQVLHSGVTDWTEYEWVYTPQTDDGKIFGSVAIWSWNHASAQQWVDEIEFSEVIGATMIEDGAITTDKLVANAVTAVKIGAGQVVAGKLDTGAVTAGTIAAGTIVAADIAAGAITTSKLAIGRVGDNLIANGDFSGDLDGQWHGSGSYSGVTVTRDATQSKVGPASLKMTNTGASSITTSKAFQLKQLAPGKKYRIRFWVKSDNTGGSTWYLRMFRNSTVGADGFVDYLDAGSVQITSPSNPDLEALGSVGTANWTEYEWLYEPTVDNYFYSIAFYNWTGAAGVTYWLSGVEVTEQFGATLIEDGAIKTDKLDALAVTAGKVAANAITADKIVSRTITADRIGTGQITANEVDTASLRAGIITANSITAADIGAGAVTANKLSITPSGRNLIVGGSFDSGVKDLDLWGGYGHFWSVIPSVDSPVGGPFVGDFPSTNGSKIWVSKAVPLDVGARYRLSVWFKTSGTGIIYLGGWAASTPTADGFINFAEREGALSYILASARAKSTDANVWTSLSAEFVADRPWMSATILNYGGPDTLYIAEYRLEKIIGSTLIEDGAITTNKILSRTITADRIGTGQITSTEVNTDSLRAGIITAGSITAADIGAGQITAKSLAVGSPGRNLVTNGDFTNVTDINWGVNGDWYGYDIDRGAPTLVQDFTAPSGNGYATFPGYAGISSRAVRVIPGKTYRTLVRWRHTAGAGGIYFGTFGASTEGDGFLGAGETTSYVWHVLNRSKATASIGDISGVADGTWRTEIFTYTPAAGKPWVSLNVLNWVNPTTALDIDEIAIYEMVGATQIQDGAITTNKIFTRSITADRIGTGQITANEVDVGSLRAGIITAGSIKAIDIGAGEVTTLKLDSLAITAEKIDTDAIVARTIKAGEIQTQHFATNAIRSLNYDAPDGAEVFSDAGSDLNLATGVFTSKYFTADQTGVKAAAFDLYKGTTRSMQYGTAVGPLDTYTGFEWLTANGTPNATISAATDNGTGLSIECGAGHIDMDNTGTSMYSAAGGIGRGISITDEGLFIYSNNGGFLNFNSGILQVTGVLAADTGTAANPAITFWADQNTGFYRYAENELAIATGAGYRARFTAAGLYLASGDWFRTEGNVGWYNQTHSVGWHATQGGHVETYPAGTTGVIAQQFLATNPPTTTTYSGYNDALYGGFNIIFKYTSTREAKANVKSLSKTLDTGAIIDALRPVQFVAKPDPDDSEDMAKWKEADVEVGFIAEEVSLIQDGWFASYSHTDDPDEPLGMKPSAWRHRSMIALAIEELKRLRTRVADLEATNNAGDSTKGK